MTDHILSIALTFSLLAGGTAAIGSELFASQGKAAAPVAVAVITLPTVVVTGKRLAATVVASVSRSGETQRVE